LKTQISVRYSRDWRGKIEGIRKDGKVSEAAKLIVFVSIIL